MDSGQLQEETERGVCWPVLSCGDVVTTDNSGKLTTSPCLAKSIHSQMLAHCASVVWSDSVKHQAGHVPGLTKIAPSRTTLGQLSAS